MKIETLLRIKIAELREKWQRVEPGAMACIVHDQMELLEDILEEAEDTAEQQPAPMGLKGTLCMKLGDEPVIIKSPGDYTEIRIELDKQPDLKPVLPEKFDTVGHPNGSVTGVINMLIDFIAYQQKQIETTQTYNEGIR